MASTLKLRHGDLYGRDCLAVKVGDMASISVVDIVPEEHIVSPLREGQHGGKALQIPGQAKRHHVARPDHTRHHIKWHFEACLGCRSSCNRIAADDNRVAEHIVPTLTVDKLLTVFSLVEFEADLEMTFGRQ